MLVLTHTWYTALQGAYQPHVQAVHRQFITETYMINLMCARSILDIGAGSKLPHPSLYNTTECDFQESWFKD